MFKRCPRLKQYFLYYSLPKLPPNAKVRSVHSSGEKSQWWVKKLLSQIHHEYQNKHLTSL